MDSTPGGQIPPGFESNKNIAKGLLGGANDSNGFQNMTGMNGLISN
jgi:hypothetical protein